MLDITGNLTATTEFLHQQQLSLQQQQQPHSQQQQVKPPAQPQWLTMQPTVPAPTADAQLVAQLHQRFGSRKMVCPWGWLVLWWWCCGRWWCHHRCCRCASPSCDWLPSDVVVITDRFTRDRSPVSPVSSFPSPLSPSPLPTPHPTTSSNTRKLRHCSVRGCARSTRCSTVSEPSSRWTRPPSATTDGPSRRTQVVVEVVVETLAVALPWARTHSTWTTVVAVGLSWWWSWWCPLTLSLCHLCPFVSICVTLSHVIRHIASDIAHHITSHHIASHWPGRALASIRREVELRVDHGSGGGGVETTHPTIRVDIPQEHATGERLHATIEPQLPLHQLFHHQQERVALVKSSSSLSSSPSVSPSSSKPTIKKQTGSDEDIDMEDANGEQQHEQQQQQQRQHATEESRGQVTLDHIERIHLELQSAQRTLMDVELFHEVTDATRSPPFPLIFLPPPPPPSFSSFISTSSSPSPSPPSPPSYDARSSDEKSNVHTVP